MKQIEITFNDDTTQENIDYQAARIMELLEAQGLTVVIIVKDEEVNEDIIRMDDLKHVKVLRSAHHAK